LEREQAAKFRRLVRLVNERSPYYRSIIQERSLDIRRCVPSDFPILTKQTVAEQFDRILTDRRLSRARIEAFLENSRDPAELLDGRFHVLHSSGTSGTIGLSVYSHRDWIKAATQMIRAIPFGLRMRVAYVAAARGHFAGASLLATGNHQTNRLFFKVRAYDVSQPMDSIVAALNEFQPQVLTGYAAILERLAEAQADGSLHISPRAIVSGAEPLRARCRAMLQRTFHVPVINAYASSEHLFMALTLPGSEGMYLLEDDLMFELHHDSTCVTNLFNETLPLIRYCMDDVLIPEPDPSGRYPFTKIRDLVGRSEDSPSFRNREGALDFIHPSLIGELLVPGLKSWQMQLIDETAFIFRARFEPGLDPKARQTVRGRIREQLGSLLAEKRMDNVTFEIEEVERLKVDPKSGKTRMILKPEPGRASIGEREPVEATGRGRVTAWPRGPRSPRTRADARGTTSTPSR
jgi:phenylacetate-coenzyme A ligase PaaK-like adenylate-forming protein